MMPSTSNQENSILAIDPGPKQSGAVLIGFRGEEISPLGILSNNDIINQLRKGDWRTSYMAIEKICSYGMAVGETVFSTAEWSGRFIEAWLTQWLLFKCSADPSRVLRIPRLWIKTHLCKSARAKDANIRQALIDRFGPKGTKKNPGPTYGFKAHMWSALAVGATALDITQKTGWIYEAWSQDEDP